MANSYIDINYADYLKVFTDSSNTPNGRVSAAFYIPELNVEISKRLTNIISIYTAEMVAIKMELDYITETVSAPNSDTSIAILSESLSALASLLVGKSTASPNLFLEVHTVLHNLNLNNIFVRIPSHIGSALAINMEILQLV